MQIDSAFPSKYIKESDLQGRKVTVVMGDVKMEKIGGEDNKPVLYFRGKEKGLVLNKINSNMISKGYGKNTDDWFGQQIVLFPTTTEYAGETVPCIRVALPAKDAEQAPQPRRSEPLRENDFAADVETRERPSRAPATRTMSSDDFPGEPARRPRPDIDDSIPF